MSTSKGIYPKNPYKVGSAQGVTVTKRGSEKLLPVRHNVPGNIILVHGVNDVGTSYAAVEQGLCEGLTIRLNGQLHSAEYRLPVVEDRSKLDTDPDSVFFKRKITKLTHSPVIPFYWGFRELTELVQTDIKRARGQQLDRHGNRLDKDFSKGGGPFANATTTLPDMWNRGKWSVFGALDYFQKDATHPVLNCPGRLYMVLAAYRLAALVCMIRDYDEDETVSIVAHSQGCMISLLAQAFLLDSKFIASKNGARPADTLILNNPPYSLVDSPPAVVSAVDRYTDSDKVMEKHYLHINGIQTLNARLTTLSNIVRGVWEKKHAFPPLAELNDPRKHFGAVGPGWNALGDRDNRGKVYLYFGPEDMTVALANVQGIGWQGVPYFQRGVSVKRVGGRGIHAFTKDIVRQPLQELGAGFRQRVFTMKLRPDPQAGRPVRIGAESPFDFLLRAANEDDQAHTALSDTDLSKSHIRAHLPRAEDANADLPVEEIRTHGLRRINGELLKKPTQASLLEGARTDRQGRPGAEEQVDPIDAAIAVTSPLFGLEKIWECIPHEAKQKKFSTSTSLLSPCPPKFEGKVGVVTGLAADISAKMNSGKTDTGVTEIISAYVCLDTSFSYSAVSPGKILVQRYESPDEARSRWQNTVLPRSFHGAIFGGKENHKNVTAHDVAIGSGKASSDPNFYRYLCAVADWRIQKISDKKRLGILPWEEFLENFSCYISVEPAWRRAAIEGNSIYYSTGVLPPGLPLLPDSLPGLILNELKE